MIPKQQSLVTCWRLEPHCWSPSLWQKWRPRTNRHNWK